MNFQETELAGVVVIELESYVDERGVFTRTFDAELFDAQGLNPRVTQCSNSFNPRAGTLRGMHYQLEPYAECKLVRCTRGSVYDVVIDLRRDSPTHGRWLGLELSAHNMLCALVPEGCAHGFQTLEDDSEVLYQITPAYVPDAQGGVRWDDPAFAIQWPPAPNGDGRLISARDRAFPDYEP
ncbi:MAG TPA: dTDP-4-dehydrorhamnose 3,5-epimerase [Solirubrobacteraceae bacterium]|nr:dTDP-4-dehydrorhamnose 3,5-epimerase [Solirubrobacteraceae bacterium]